MVAAALCSLYFSSWATGFYSSVIHARYRALRLAGRAILLLFFMLRVSRQFSCALPATAVMAAGLAVLLGPTLALLTATLAAAVAIMAAAKLEPDDSVGHRAGAEGYSGLHCENSLQALTALALRDARGDFSSCSFPYIEVCACNSVAPACCSLLLLPLQLQLVLLVV